MVQTVELGTAGVLRGAAADRLAATIDKIGKDGFDAAVLEFIAAYCPFDSALIVLYSTRRRPKVIVDHLRNSQRTNSADIYVSGAYLLDPFYIYSGTTKSPQAVRMSDIVVERFDESDYFVNYYKQSGVTDEVNYLIPLPDQRVYAISVERSVGKAQFSEREILTARELLPTLAALVLRHMALPGRVPPPEDADAEHERLEELLRTFGAAVLTPRECEVVQLMLKGYSMLAIGDLLGVSVETVRVHRRNIYEKMQISSLAELFSLALKAIFAAR